MLLNLPNVQQMMAALGIVPKARDPLRYLLQQEEISKESLNRDEYDHIMSEVFFFLKEEDTLEASLVCKKWRACLPLVTPKLCRLKGLPCTKSFWYYCLMLGHSGPYTHLFDRDCFQEVALLLDGDVKDVQAILNACMPIVTQMLGSDLILFYKKLRSFLTKERIDLLKQLFAAQLDGNPTLLDVALQLGNVHLLALTWNAENLAQKMRVLQMASTFGSMALLYSLDVSYPNFVYTDTVPESWITDQIKDAQMAKFLLRTALNEGRLDICEAIFSLHNCVEASLIEVCDSKAQLDWFSQHCPDTTHVLSTVCNFIDLDLDYLKHKDLNSAKPNNFAGFEGAWLKALIKQKKFDCLEYALLHAKNYQGLTSGELKLVAYLGTHSLAMLDTCINDGDCSTLKTLLIIFENKINWTLLVQELQQRKSVAPSILICVLKLDLERADITLPERWCKFHK